MAREVPAAPHAMPQPVPDAQAAGQKPGKRRRAFGTCTGATVGGGTRGPTLSVRLDPCEKDRESDRDIEFCAFEARTMELMDEVKKLGLLKLREVAHGLGVSPLTMMREGQRNRIKLVKIAGQWFVQADVLREYLAAAGATPA